MAPGPPRRADRKLAEAERLVRAALERDAERFDLNRFLLAHGTAWAPVERSRELEPGVRHRPFRNAFRLARAGPDLRYCEGFTLPRGYDDAPNRHAWCVDTTGAAIDPTPGWAEPGTPLRPCYFGIAIPLAFAAPYADPEAEEPTRGVLFELTGRINLLAAELGLDPV